MLNINDSSLFIFNTPKRGKTNFLSNEKALAECFLDLGDYETVQHVRIAKALTDAPLHQYP